VKLSVILAATAILTILPGTVPAVAGEAVVAVAANFYRTVERITAAFEIETGDEIVLVQGSTGKLYAQIVNGAPYDIFLSADQARPARLFAEGLSGAPRTYAVGKLAYVFTKDSAPALDDLGTTPTRVALADPAIAPYGVASQQVLTRLRGETGWNKDAVFGENVGQTYGFVVTGNATAGFVALSQVFGKGDAIRFTAVPEDWYTAIRQDGVITNRGSDNAVAASFMDFLGSGRAFEIIRKDGYGIPQ